MPRATRRVTGTSVVVLKTETEKVVMIPFGSFAAGEAVFLNLWSERILGSTDRQRVTLE
jgi:hypothetical protein